MSREMMKIGDRYENALTVNYVDGRNRDDAVWIKIGDAGCVVEFQQLFELANYLTAAAKEISENKIKYLRKQLGSYKGCTVEEAASNIAKTL